MHTITIYNTKGGTSKSTLATNLGANLARRPGNRVLLIDGDPQGNLSSAYPLATAIRAGYRQVIEAGQSDAPFPQEAITPTQIENLDLVAANISNDELKSLLDQSQESHTSLLVAIQALREANLGYTHVVIDSSGTPGIISYTCAIAADSILSPTVPDKFSVEAFIRGASDLARNLDNAPRWAPYRNLKISVVVSRLRKHTTSGSAYLDMLQQQLAPHRTQGTPLQRVTLLNTYIPDSQAFVNATNAMEPVYVLDKNHGATIDTLIDELLGEA
jgi:cellulose biosynthesis protein BcsQ